MEGFKKGPSSQQASKIDSSPNRHLHSLECSKYSKYPLEIKAVREYLTTNTATATMTAQALDIYRPNLSRIKRKLEKKGLLKEVRIGICKVTGFRAAYLSTDPNLLKGGTNG